MVAKNKRATGYGLGVLLIAAALLYLLTLDNGLRPDELTGGDLITHQYAQVEGRPSNAPGYPLYTLGGWLWFRLGRFLLSWALNPIQILSLYSTLWGLASLLVLYLILLRVTRRQWPIALLLAAFYAVTFFFWYYTVTTEQYTSAVLQTLLIIWLAFRWDEQPHDSALLWLAFLAGTMLANMVTTLFILPPLLWFIFSKGDQPTLFRPKLVLTAIILALLPLLSYLYIFLSGTLHPEWRGAGEWPNAWAWFVDFLTIQQGRDELAPGLSLQNFFTAEFPALMGQELTWPVFFGGLVGLAFLGRRRAIFLYSTLLIYFSFCWLYRFGNWFQVIIPAYPIFIIGAAAGLKRISREAWANERGGEDARRRGREETSRTTHHAPRFTLHVSRPTPHVLLLTSYSLLLLLLLYRFTTNLPRADQSHLPTDTGLDPGWAILADRPAPPALISGDFSEQIALQYLGTVWGAAPSLTPREPGDFTTTEQTDTRSVSYYLTRRAAAAAPETINLGEKYPQAAGEQLVALWPAPRREIPATALPLNLRFGETLKLVGWEKVDPAYSLPDDVAGRLAWANWQIALYWQTSQPLEADYTISVRPLVGGQLISVNGEALIQDHQPVWGLYPTGHWRPGEIVRDVYALSLPPEVKPEAIQVVVYKTTESGFENIAEQIIEDRR
ncbi:MAG: hypothetical protein DPW09_19850 [Anaerolineae bacterium]|nr:DUF2723 domain-containing protein [Anaerolineales bacterium]MCQ3975696.1 hypothetical protein [Anaerolineae bacterium]